MKQVKELTQENFSDLMNWLSSNPESAGEKYEEVREGLIRFFRFRGCDDSEFLADETITRVAGKVKTLDMSANVGTISFFYGFAKNIFREYLAKQDRNETDFESIKFKIESGVGDGSDYDDLNLECLDNCLNEMPADDRKSLLRYYLKNGKEKLDLRRKIARELNLKKGTLHTKIHRLKIDVRKCMEKCMKEKIL